MLHYFDLLSLPLSILLGGVAVTQGITPTPSPSTTPFHRDETACNGSEMQLADCSFDNTDIALCDHTLDDMGISCQIDATSTPTCTEPTAPVAPVEGDVRLTSSSVIGDSVRGRVEICLGTPVCSWTSVCDDQFGVEEAIVVCNQLGFAGSGM